jgi:hypothetical protein
MEDEKVLSTTEEITAQVLLRQSQLLKSVEALTEDQLTQRPGPTAPPIGWHFWHATRYTDLLQASFPNQPPDRQQPVHPERHIWQAENLIAQWGLPADKLGFLESGLGMDHDVAATIPGLIGRERLLDYGQRVFDALTAALTPLGQAELMAPRLTMHSVKVNPTSGQIEEDYTQVVTVVYDLLRHYGHVARHLGMIEALRGVLFTVNGTASL